jgi:DNA polymerase III delta prime subunit
MKELLLTEKYRPKTLEDLILLPRISKIFENGITQNVILHGNYGTGKTTLSRILIGKYTKDKPYIEINSSLYTSIDIIRSKIDEFCSTTYMGFDTDISVNSDSMKYVFLDEFERTSVQAQDSLKALIEKYHKNVRFILTTNHINKVSDGIRSRFKEVNFDCNGPDEERYLKTQIYKRISEVISVKEDFKITKDDLIKIINKKFPDFRGILVEIEHFKRTGDSSIGISVVNVKLKNDLYSIIYDKSKSYEDIYHFLMNNFGADKIDEMIKLFGKQFIEYTLNEKRDNIDKLFNANYIICEYTQLLETATDPILVGMGVLGKLRELFI